MFLNKPIAIQSNSLYLLYNSWLAGFPAILDACQEKMGPFKHPWMSERLEKEA